MAKIRKKRHRRTPAVKQKFTIEMQKKLVVLFVVILLAFVVLITRLVSINVVEGERYAKIVLDQQQYNSNTIPFKRGDIVDTNGIKLATSERVYKVILDAKLLLGDTDKKDENVRTVETVLEQYFGISPTDVEAILQEKSGSNYVVMKKSVDFATAKAYQEGISENQQNVVGVWLEEDYKRSYPYGTMACDLIGFSVDGNVGANGIEASYNEVLNGTDGRKYGYQDGESSTTKTVKEPVDGNTVVSTIDANLQAIVEKHLNAFNETYTNVAQEGMGFKNGAVLIMNPNTGEVLAMASMPDYDLNNPRDLSKYYKEEELTAMTNEEKADIQNNLWKNFCISDAFEPGSTIKPFTVSSAFETGHLNGSETFYCGGSLQVADYNIKCISYDRGGHGTQDLSQVLENSCNVALMEIGMSMGTEEFSKYQHIFGFGQSTGIDLVGENAGILYNVEDMGVVDLATNSFGQNFTATMTQVASGFCSLVNGGNYYQPHVVKEIRDQNGDVVESVSPTLLKKTISEQTSETIKTYMYNVVQNGSGSPAQVEGYDIGGKTGTAEKLPRGENKNVVSFIGYAPQDKPEVVVYVVIDEPNVPDQARCSKQITGLAADIMAEAFPYLNITKQTAE